MANISKGLGRHGRLGLGRKNCIDYTLPQLVNVNEQTAFMTEAYHALFGSEIPKDGWLLN